MCYTNEINEEDAKALVANGVIAVTEGANMPSTLEAIEVFQKLAFHLVLPKLRMLVV